MSRQFVPVTLLFSGSLFAWIVLAFECQAQTPQDTQSQSQSQAPVPSLTLDRFEPLTPEQAIDSFQIADGFRIELVAAEPLVVDPVAFCFDSQARLLVVEMRGYSERPDDHLGRLRRLTDTNNDGRMDHVETLAEGLSWPTAVECWGDGIVVATAPELLYFSDDGTQRRVLCKGFGKSNVQGLMNSLRYGLDLRLHGATSSSGGEIVGLGHESPLRLGGRDFAVDTYTEHLQAVDGGGQHGMVIDAWGDKYVCSNSDHLQQVLTLPARARRASQFSYEITRRRSIAADGPQAEVYRASPLEPWRVLRTHLRVTGQAPGPIEGGGRAAGYFTGATGVWIYEDDQWPQSPFPIALVCDVGSNLVHRKYLKPNGLLSIGVRIDEQSELLRSTDTWFRPVQLGCGPDGALYIADMYREVIEHPHSLPPVIKSQVDLNSGNDKGRIWRLVAKHRPLRRDAPNLEVQSSLQLVSLLDCQNAWQRRTAARLLAHRESTEQLLASLADTVAKGSFAEGRLQALTTLYAINQREKQPVQSLARRHLVAALQGAFTDKHPRVRQAAIRLSAQLECSPDSDLRNRGSDDSLVTETLPLEALSLETLPPETLSRLANDSSVHVRFQLAMDAASLVKEPQRRAQLLTKILMHDPDNRDLLWAIEGSLLDAAGDFLQLILDAEDAAANRSAALEIALFQILRPQSSVVGNSTSSETTLQTVIRLLVTSQQPDDHRPASRDELWRAVAGAVERAEKGGANQSLVNWIATSVTPAVERATYSETLQPILASQMTMVRWADPAKANLLLSDALKPQQSKTLQQAAIQYLAGFDQDSALTISKALGQFTPETQQLAILKLANSAVGQTQLLAHVLARALPLDTMPPQVISEWTADKSIRKQLQGAGLLRADAGDGNTAATELDNVIAAYLSETAKAGDAVVGKQWFDRHCAACHTAASDGTLIGPALKSVREKTADQILLAILDPNREVDPKYRSVKVLTSYGKLVTGAVVQETDNQFVLADVQGQTHAIARADIESLETTGKSLMPEGFQDSISPEAMKHLLSFLRFGEME